MQRAVAGHDVAPQPVPRLLPRLVAGVLLLVAPVIVLAVALQLGKEPPVPCLSPFTCPELVFPTSAIERFAIVALGGGASVAWLLSGVAVVRTNWPRNATWFRSLVAVTLGLGVEAAALTALLLLQLGNGRRSAVLAAAILGLSWALVFMTAGLAGRAFAVWQDREGSGPPALRAAVVMASAVVATPVVVLLVVSIFTQQAWDAHASP